MALEELDHPHPGTQQHSGLGFRRAAGPSRNNEKELFHNNNSRWGMIWGRAEARKPQVLPPGGGGSLRPNTAVTGNKPG